ncbi:metallophosphoesterase [Georgenia alba]|uniref:Metallophosphoesterase n=1 Tax=Georgenia alba TaxID=2233858 RepID=A0ABW2Q4J3_9MICO
MSAVGLRRLGAGLALAAAGGLGWALTEATRYTLRRHTVPVLPAGAAPIRLLHLSDLHLVPSQRDKVAWVRDLAAEEPDLVVTTGDNMAHRLAVPSVLEAYAPFLDGPGAFVFGSNDYYAPEPKNPIRYFFPDAEKRVPDERLPSGELAAALSRAGWVDLNNRRDRVTVGDAQLSLVGVDDPHLDLDVFPDADDDDRAVLHLGVAHAPYRRVLDAMHDDGADLILAGHTHGGQLCVPGFGALVTNCDLDRRRASGLHGWPDSRPGTVGGEHSVWLNVSAGLGTSPYTPVRFACPPEASLLTLVPRQG